MAWVCRVIKALLLQDLANYLIKHGMHWANTQWNQDWEFKSGIDKSELVLSLKDERMVWIRAGVKCGVYAEQGKAHGKPEQCSPRLGEGASMRGARYCQKEILKKLPSSLIPYSRTIDTDLLPRNCLEVRGDQVIIVAYNPCKLSWIPCLKFELCEPHYPGLLFISGWICMLWLARATFVTHCYDVVRPQGLSLCLFWSVWIFYC